VTKLFSTTLGLSYNPFEPAASGPPLSADLWIPQQWNAKIQWMLGLVETGKGVKALVIEGEYGSGKTYLMRWLEFSAFPARRIRPFFFDNPGIQFYDLANSLLRQLGRYEFSKALWEYLRPSIGPLQPTFFASKDEFIEWLTVVKRQKRELEARKAIAKALHDKGVTSDEEVAFRLAMMIVDTLEKPFFEYRDFVAGRRDALVAEKEEANYFSAVIRALKMTGNAEGVAFLLDEFDEISFQKRLSRKQALDYLATLKRLLNVASGEDFWLVLSMTPQAAEMSQLLEPALWQRFTGRGKYQFAIPPLNRSEAEELLEVRLRKARIASEKSPFLWPFSPDVLSSVPPSMYSSPRRLVKTAFYVLTEAAKKRLKGPIDTKFFHEIDSQLYPPES
jgi:hypothetical protein